MKKLFVILSILVFVVGNANAQVKVSAPTVFGWPTKCTFHVEDIESNDLQLNMTLTGFVSLPEKPSLLLKLTDDSILELQGKRTFAAVEQMMGTDTHKEAASFPLTRGQLDMIAKGVKKLRLDTQPKFFEKEWRNGKFGKQLYKDYQKSKF